MICIYYTVVIPVASCDSQGGGQRRLTAYELAERAGHTKAFVSWIAELNRPSKQLLLKQTIWTNLFLYVSTSFKCFFCFRTLEHRLDSSYEPTRNRESSLWHLDSVFPGTSDWETVETFDSIASDWIIQWIGFWDLSLCFVLLGPDRNYADVCSPVEVVSCRVLPQNHPHVNTWRYLKILEVVVQGSFSSFFGPIAINCSYDRLEGKFSCSHLYLAEHAEGWDDVMQVMRAHGTKYLSRSYSVRNNYCGHGLNMTKHDDTWSKMERNDGT